MLMAIGKVHIFSSYAVHTVKSKGKISQNFEAFSEYMNFKISSIFVAFLENMNFRHKKIMSFFLLQAKWPSFYSRAARDKKIKTTV